MFEDLLSSLDESPFAEEPVDTKTFVEDKAFLGLPPLSDLQYRLIEASTQIYKEDALIYMYGQHEGRRRWKSTVNEVIAALGKGSGKDYCSTISVARIVYLLLCLKDPAAYFGKPPGDSIDILNIAINAQQAKNVFFKGFINRIKGSPWFAGKFNDKADSIHFDKNINVYSGHSERESWEGYNVITVILDEISGFNMESVSNNEGAKTAGAIYKMYRASVTSRFAATGKLVLLSFPRYKGDFISKRYDEVVAEKNVAKRTHTFQLDTDLPLGIPENEFTIEWDEDHIISYKTPKVFAMKRPTWEVNPIQDLEDMKNDFFNDPVDSLSRFACMPPDAVDAFFKSREKIEKAFRNARIAIDPDTQRFEEWFKPDKDKEYFVHVDLAEKFDRCAVSMAHVESWSAMKETQFFNEPVPNVVVDVVKWWTPTSDKNVDFSEVRDFVKSLRQRGFSIKLVTFDRWNSSDSMRELTAYGMNVERLSVAKKHYDDFQLLVQEERLLGPALEIITEELLALKITKQGKVDHTRHGKKDLSDAIAGAIFNAVAGSQREYNDQIEVYDMESLMRKRRSEELAGKEFPEGTIRPPHGRPPEIPNEVRDFLENLKVI